MKHYESSEATCPFYHGESGQKVLCEGVEPGVTTHVTFASPVLGDNYRARFCHNKDMRYRFCKYYQTVSSKY